MRKTSTYLLIEMSMKTDLQEFVEGRRAEGDSWDAITRSIYDRTRIPLTSATLRNWFAPVPTQAAS